MIIYKATNLINGKVYIGQTVQTLSARKSKHKNESIRKKYNYPFYNAIRLYGWSNFQWEIIDHANSIDYLNFIEAFWINHHNSINRKYGYNLKAGGNNRKMPKSVKNKISKANKGRKFTKEHCENLSKVRKGKPMSMERKLKQSVAMKGRKFSEEHKRNKSIAQLGEKNPGSKLTTENVIEIKTRIKNGESNTSIAKDFPVSHKMISNIKCGNTWGHVAI